MSVEFNIFDDELGNKSISKSKDKKKSPPAYKDNIDNTAIWMMKELDGMSYREIGRRLSISPNTVRNRYLRTSKEIED